MRNKIFKIICILMLIIFSILIIINARKIKNTIISTNNSEINTYTENTTDTTEPEYVEGQAIMITVSNQPTMFFSKSRESSILDELEVEEIGDFNYSNNASTYSLNSRNDRQEITISLVTSDKYTTKELIEKLENEGIYAEPNYIFYETKTTNDEYSSYQWGIENNGQNGGTPGADINPISISNGTTEERVIAIVDTGVDYTHEDLKNVMWINPYSDSEDLPGQYGYDFGDNDDNPMDETSHGTHVAGIIAAESNNEKGITGAVLNNSNIKIMALKAKGSDGKITLGRTIEAYGYIKTAMEKGVNVVAINNSYGLYANKDGNNNTLLKDNIISMTAAINAVGSLGAISVCSAGNEARNLDTDSQMHIPSDIDSEYIISVSASNERDELASFSCYGGLTQDIAAPGENILSTVSFNCFNPSIYTDEQRQKLCSEYENFDDLTTVDNLNITTSSGTVEICEEEYFGLSGKSIKWTVPNAIKGKKYTINFPYLNQPVRNVTY